MTHDRANEHQEAVIATHFGDADLDMAGVEAIRTIIADTGAQAHVEALIEKLTMTALDALTRDEIDANAHALLSELATIAIRRSI